MADERPETKLEEGLLHDWIYERKIVSMKSKGGILCYRNFGVLMYCLTIFCPLVHGGEGSVCFGVKLGERVVHAPTRFDSVLSKSFLLSDNILGPKSSLRVNCKTTHIKIDRPFFGLNEATASCDENGLVFGLTVNGSFRRGMTRTESFAKLLELREEVIKRIGFEIGEYSFSTQGFQKLGG